jgi:hypothetical protein
MATTYAIVYATASKAHCMTIVDDEGQVSAGLMPDNVTQAVIVSHSFAPPTYHPIASGLSVLIVAVPPNAVTTDNFWDWCTHIQNATGVAPPQLVCALIDGTNTVQQMIVADPAVATAPPGFTMVLAYSPLIAIGHTYDPATGLFTAPAYTIPAFAPGNKGSALPKHVAAAVIPLP